ncbi:nucleotidyltransferase domain-containing protein [Rubrivivax albus]|uniref:nucleotidyltransferase domain-containing protein n=1 Tax=Rubrivivax albus TaxID=2499835 RepID=UPI0018EE71A3|nr:nucleotidyltransferase domain-containing protein [Rubrivivax albus]
MRLTYQQTRHIVATAQRHFGLDARVALSGSWLDDAVRNGDVDLLEEAPAPPTLEQRALATMELEGVLQLPVDILAVRHCDVGSAFVQAVRPRAVSMELVA